MNEMADQGFSTGSICIVSSSVVGMHLRQVCLKAFDKDMLQWLVTDIATASDAFIAFSDLELKDGLGRQGMDVSETWIISSKAKR